MVVVVGTGSIGSVVGSDFVARTAVEVDIDFGIDCLGTAQADTMLAPIQLEPSPHFSLSRC